MVNACGWERGGKKNTAVAPPLVKVLLAAHPYPNLSSIITRPARSIQRSSLQQVIWLWKHANLVLLCAHGRLQMLFRLGLSPSSFNLVIATVKVFQNATLTKQSHYRLDCVFTLWILFMPHPEWGILCGWKGGHELSSWRSGDQSKVCVMLAYMHIYRQNNENQWKKLKWIIVARAVTRASH